MTSYFLKEMLAKVVFTYSSSDIGIAYIVYVKCPLYTGFNALV